MKSRRSSRSTSFRKLGELERYGLLALVAGVILALGFLAEELRRDRAVDERANARVHLGDRGVNPVAKPMVARPVDATPGGGEPPPLASRSDFDFFEPPVPLPGRPTVEVPPPPSGAYEVGGKVVVKKGDTLQSIALRELGSAEQWRRLVQANPGIDPRRLAVGQVLELPGHGRAPAAEPSPESRLARYYEVSRNDTLERISLRYYGTRTRWMDILEANRDVIRSPEQLRIGARIRIP